MGRRPLPRTGPIYRFMPHRPPAGKRAGLPVADGSRECAAEEARRDAWMHREKHAGTMRPPKSLPRSASASPQRSMAIDSVSCSSYWMFWAHPAMYTRRDYDTQACSRPELRWLRFTKNAFCRI